MQRETTPLVVTEGTPFERGRQLGLAVHDRVGRTVDAYFDLFQHHAGLERAAALRATESFVPVIQRSTPNLLEEMRGIADGSGQDTLEIIAINARTELMYGVTRRGECTSVAATPAASSDGHVRIGQNWDWFAWLAGNTVLWAIRRDEGPDVLTFCEAGLVGKIGVNASGLGLCVNLLMSDSDNPGPALPMHLILRHVLDTAGTVDEAVSLISETPRCTSVNHLVADATGAVIDLESTPAGSSVIHPQRGIITHANHCCDPALGPVDRYVRDFPESLARGDRASSLAGRAPISEDELRTLLADHETAPGSICLHPRLDVPPAEQDETVASILMDLTARTFDLADGPPCSEAYRRFALDEVFGAKATLAAD
jgi:isopenicillin-N N-acyltransferase like protein